MRTSECLLGGNIRLSATQTLTNTHTDSMSQNIPLRGTVKAVPSGDTVIVVNTAQKSGIPAEKKVTLSGISVPRIGYRKDNTQVPDEVMNLAAAHTTPFFFFWLCLRLKEPFEKFDRNMHGRHESFCESL